MADADGDKMVDRDEFFAVLQKVFAKGDIEIGAVPEKTVIVVDSATGAGTAVAEGDATSSEAVAAATQAAVEAAPISTLGESGADDSSRVGDTTHAQLRK